MFFCRCISGFLFLKTPGWDRKFFEMEVASRRLGPSSPMTINPCNQRQSYSLRRFRRRRFPPGQGFCVSLYGQPIFRLAQHWHFVHNIPRVSLFHCLLPQGHVPLPTVHILGNGSWTKLLYVEVGRLAGFKKCPLELPS
jgi:hypothetical protein